MTPQDAKQLEDDQRVCLLVGGFNPPTMSYWWTVDHLFTVPKIDHVWLCPLAEPNEESAALSMIMASSFPKPVTCCTVAMDKGFSKVSDILEWCRKKYAKNSFISATLAPNLEGDLVVCFNNQNVVTETGKQVLRLDQYLRIEEGHVAQMISRGEDAKRKLPESVWNYILRHNLYRGKGEPSSVPNS